eukprot:scaffold270867_cov18-Tisochrysis_lutea.AAC.1
MASLSSRTCPRQPLPPPGPHARLYWMAAAAAAAWSCTLPAPLCARLLLMPWGWCPSIPLPCSLSKAELPLPCNAAAPGCKS